MTIIPAPGLVVQYLNRNVRILEIDQECVHIKMPIGSILTVSIETLKRFARPIEDRDAPPLPVYAPPVRKYYPRKRQRYGEARYSESGVEKRCIGCGDFFITHDTQQTRCIRDCGRAKQRVKRPEGLPFWDGVCELCKEPFTTNRPVKRFCTVTCRRAFFNRRAVKIRAAQTDNATAPITTDGVSASIAQPTLASRSDCLDFIQRTSQ